MGSLAKTNSKYKIQSLVLQYFSNKSESLQKRPVPFIPPLLTSGTDSNGNIQLTAAINGHSDLESGDETHSITTNISMTHPIFNGFNNDAFPRYSLTIQKEA